MARRTPSHSQLDLFAPPPTPETPPRIGAVAVSPAIAAVAGCLPSHLYLGTSSWAFPGWQGLVYDRTASPQEQVRAIPLEDAPALIIRWMLHPARRYEEVKTRYQPFDHIVDDDPHNRQTIATLCLAALAAGRPTFVIANNKAEGSAPCTVFKLATGLAQARASTSA